VVSFRTAYTEQKRNEIKIKTPGLSNFPATAILPAGITLFGEIFSKSSLL
jgi:hypothetical protein